jgi:hypothetical protein
MNLNFLRLRKGHGLLGSFGEPVLFPKRTSRTFFPFIGNHCSVTISGRRGIVKPSHRKKLCWTTAAIATLTQSLKNSLTAEENMYLAKGVVFGLLLFGVFTLIYFRGIMGPIRQGVATGVNVLATAFNNPLYWVVGAATMVTSCLWAKVLHSVFERH